MFLKPIQNGFGDFHFIKPVTHIPHDETWHSYTLPKEDPKNIYIYISRGKLLEFC